MIRAFFIFCLLLVAISSRAHAEEIQAPLSASSPWNLNYSKSSCELRRNFGEGEEQVMLVINQGYTFGRLEIILITPRVGNTRTYSKAKISIGSSTISKDIHTTIYPSIEKGKSVWRLFNISVDLLKHSGLEGILSIKLKRVPNLGFQVGPLLPASDALETCQRNLFDDMGMDYDALSKLKQFPEPKGNAGRWVTASDYPKAAFKQRLEGKTQFKLEVDESGKVKSCDVLVSSGHPELDRTTCEKASQRAQFIAARDQNDQPAAAPWVSAVFWQVPR